MKKSIIIIAAICIANFVFAQDEIRKEYKNAIAWHISGFTPIQNTAIVGGIIGNVFSSLFGLGSTSGPTSHPQYSLSYSRKMTNVVTLDIIAAKQQLLTDTDAAISQSSFLIKTDMIWLPTKRINLYSGTGIGLSQIKAKNGNIQIAELPEKPEILKCSYHITALGFETKGRVSFFAELGVGALGILNSGINVRF